MKIDQFAPPSPHPGDRQVGILRPPLPAYPDSPPPQPPPLPVQPARRAPVNYQPAEGGWWLRQRWPLVPTRNHPGPHGSARDSHSVSNPSGHAQTVVVQVANPMYPPNSMAQPFVTAPPKSKMTAGLLAIFLGGLGIHRFYLGNNGLGVVMLLITVLSLGLLSPLRRDLGLHRRSRDSRRWHGSRARAGRSPEAVRDVSIDRIASSP